MTVNHLLLPERFIENAFRSPDAPCVHFKGCDYNYAEIEHCSDLLANELALRKLSRGARVMITVRNSPEYVVAYLGVLRAGCTVVALNHQISVGEFMAIAADCQPEALIVEPDRLRELALSLRSVCPIEHLFTLGSSDSLRAFAEETEPHLGNSVDLPQLEPEDVAQIIYTSGTTGRPKGVVLTHANIAANCESIIEYLQLTPSDSVLVVLPFFYSYGNSLLFTHLACGGRLVIATDSIFWSRNTSLMIDQQVTGFSGVPSTYSLLLHKSDFSRREFPSLRYLTCAGGRLSPALTERVQAVVPHAELFLMYGQTEATARLSTLYPKDIRERPGSIGKGIPGVHLTVRDDDGNEVAPHEVGEIVANGQNIMAGYWNDDELTSKVCSPSGLHTGDLGYRDTDGYLYIVGRKDDMIKSGGHRIYPSEIEDVISQIPGIAEVAVIGVPDSLLYERPVAVVVPSNTAVPFEDEVLHAICAKQLPPHKRPREVIVVNSLPKTGSGKIKRKMIADMVSSSRGTTTRHESDIDSPICQVAK